MQVVVNKTSSKIYEKSRILCLLDWEVLAFWLHSCDSLTVDCCNSCDCFVVSSTCSERKKSCPTALHLRQLSMSKGSNFQHVYCNILYNYNWNLILCIKTPFSKTILKTSQNIVGDYRIPPKNPWCCPPCFEAHSQLFVGPPPLLSADSTISAYLTGAWHSAFSVAQPGIHKPKMRQATLESIIQDVQNGFILTKNGWKLCMVSLVFFSSFQKAFKTALGLMDKILRQLGWLETQQLMWSYVIFRHQNTCLTSAGWPDFAHQPHTQQCCHQNLCTSSFAFCKRSSISGRTKLCSLSAFRWTCPGVIGVVP